MVQSSSGSPKGAIATTAADSLPTMTISPWWRFEQHLSVKPRETARILCDSLETNKTTYFLGLNFYVITKNQPGQNLDILYCKQGCGESKQV